MNRHNLYLLISGLLVAGFIAAPALAKDDEVLPPPTEVHDTQDSRQTIETSLPAEEGLEDALIPDEEEVQVRAYTREDGAKVSEYSANGRVYMIKVQPGEGLPAYYLYDTDGDGTFEKRLPGGYKRPSPPMWVIKKF